MLHSINGGGGGKCFLKYPFEIHSRGLKCNKLYVGKHVNLLDSLHTGKFIVCPLMSEVSVVIVV